MKTLSLLASAVVAALLGTQGIANELADDEQDEQRALQDLHERLEDHRYELLFANTIGQMPVFLNDAGEKIGSADIRAQQSYWFDRQTQTNILCNGFMVATYGVKPEDVDLEFTTNSSTLRTLWYKAPAERSAIDAEQVYGQELGDDNVKSYGSCITVNPEMLATRHVSIYTFIDGMIEEMRINPNAHTISMSSKAPFGIESNQWITFNTDYPPPRITFTPPEGTSQTEAIRLLSSAFKQTTLAVPNENWTCDNAGYSDYVLEYYSEQDFEIQLCDEIQYRPSQSP